MKYYMYLERHDEAETFVVVDDVEEFAKTIYNPKTMSFTGVRIEAAGPKEAIEAYESPFQKQASIEWVPEPIQTACISEIGKMQSTLDDLSYLLKCSILFMRVAKEIQQCNDQLCETAYYIHKQKGRDEEEVYNQLKERYIEHFRKLRFKPFNPSQG